jgi:hypothetical protein
MSKLYNEKLSENAITEVHSELSQISSHCQIQFS